MIPYHSSCVIYRIILGKSVAKNILVYVILSNFCLQKAVFIVTYTLFHVSGSSGYDEHIKLVFHNLKEVTININNFAF